MTPLYDLNSPPSPYPLVDLKQQQNLQFFLSLPQHTASSSSATHKPDQEPKPYDHKVNAYMTHDGGSSDQQASSSSWSRKEDGDYEGACDHNNNGSSVKWMPSKMRIMRKMTNTSCSSSSPPPLADIDNKAVNNKFRIQYPNPIHDSDETNSLSKANNAIRVCSDCNTTTTPLWRSGPRGPKSLCNACGIRQRKARRALEVAANGSAVGKEKDANTTMKIKVHNKKEIKKSRTVYHHHHHQIQRQKKLCFKNFAISLSKSSALQRVFPRDVEDAAILLMELSCGPFHA